MEKTKLITFKLTGPSGHIIGLNPQDLITTVMGDVPADYFEEHLNDGDYEKYTITVERKYTQEDLDKMPESDGDIN